MEQGITAGYEDGSFGVNQTITRQEMAVMASKFAAQYKDAAVSASANLAGYADAGELDSWASEAMSWALSSGVMQAVDGKLSPKSTVSPGQHGRVWPCGCMSWAAWIWTPSRRWRRTGPRRPSCR